jgi:hypothetical protein
MGADGGGVTDRDRDRLAFLAQASSDLRCIMHSLDALLEADRSQADRESIHRQARWLAETIEDRLNTYQRQERTHHE